MEIKEENLKNIVKTALTEAICELITKAVGSQKKVAKTKVENDPIPIEEPKQEEVIIPKQREYSFIEVRAILTEKSRAGFTDKVKELVNKYGNGKLSDVKPENFANLVEEAELNCREPFTLDDIKEEVRKLEDDGFGSNLKELFEHHFATSADNLKPEHYPSFVRDSWRIRNAGN